MPIWELSFNLSTDLFNDKYFLTTNQFAAPNLFLVCIHIQQMISNANNAMTIFQGGFCFV